MNRRLGCVVDYEPAGAGMRPTTLANGNRKTFQRRASSTIIIAKKEKANDSPTEEESR